MAGIKVYTELLPTSHYVLLYLVKGYARSRY